MWSHTHSTCPNIRNSKASSNKTKCWKENFASSSRKKRCGQCVGCIHVTPDCGKRLSCADKKSNGGMGKLNKGCIHHHCTGGKPTSTTSSLSSSCTTNSTILNLSDVCVPSRQPSNSQAVSAALSQAILLQLYSAWLKPYWSKT